MKKRNAKPKASPKTSKAVCGEDRRNCGTVDPRTQELKNGCGYRFTPDDAKGPEAVCPKCGMLRMCTVTILMPNGKCAVHGGKNPVGFANGNFSTGRYSQAMPEHLLGLWETALQDEDLTSHKEDILLLQTRLLQLLQRGDSINLYERLNNVWEDFERASRTADEQGMKDSLAEMDKLIRRGKAEAGTWREIYSVLQDLERGRINERKRMDDLKQMIPAERAMMLIAALTDAVRKHVTDQSALSGVAAEFRRIIGGSIGARLVGRKSADES